MTDRPNDAHLFDFNAGLLADYDDDKARAELQRHGDAFRFQLIAALHLSEWAERLDDPDDPLRKSMDIRESRGWVSDAEIRGWVNALHAVAAYLRQGYYLPGGSLFEEVVGERQPPS
jgi:hypothetical protein